MTNIRKSFEKIEKICLTLSLATLFIMMLWIFVDVIMRYFFNSPIPGTMELTGEYFMVLIVFPAIAFTYKHNGHVKVDLLETKLPPKLRAALAVFKQSMILIILSLMFVSNVQLFLDYLSRDIRSVGSLEYLIAPAFLIMALGVLLMIVRLLFDIYEIFITHFKHEYAYDQGEVKTTKNLERK